MRSHNRPKAMSVYLGLERKNMNNEAVENLRETLDDMIRWRNRISGTALYQPDMMEMSLFIVRLNEQIGILEDENSNGKNP